MRGAIRTRDREKGADRVLVSVQPLRHVGDAVGNRIPCDPVRSLDRQLCAVDQAAAVRESERPSVMPFDRRERVRACDRPLGVFGFQGAFREREDPLVEPEGQTGRILHGDRNASAAVGAKSGEHERHGRRQRDRRCRGPSRVTSSLPRLPAPPRGGEPGRFVRHRGNGNGNALERRRNRPLGQPELRLEPQLAAPPPHGQTPFAGANRCPSGHANGSPSATVGEVC
jgi:hypothetical protein